MNTKSLFIAVLFLGVSSATLRAVDAIPYPTPGVPNPVVYIFTAANNGDIVAYFAGSTAAYHNELGLLVNGTDTGIYGLENHSSAIGLSLDFGPVSAGDVLTFVLLNHTLGDSKAYSNPALNGPYDSRYAPSPGMQHVYSTPYTQNPPRDSIPVGTFVSFEDLPASNPPDWNYNDEDFVFTNVATTVPAPAAVWAGLILFALMVGWRLARRAHAA